MTQCLHSTNPKMASIPVNFVIIVSLFSFIFFLIGIHNLITRVEDNACEMTYMFEYPQFVKLSFPEKVQKRFPRYSLHGYSEGSGTEELRRMRFTGVPVLFVPGNSGSHKQGRSLASVALRMALNSRSSFHFDFFMVDFNEDLSGIYGGVLDNEAEFVASSLDVIQGLYRKNVSVILIGHSAGGIITKGVFTLKNFDPGVVKLVLNLATPHSAPVLLSDRYLSDFYKKVDNFWKQHSDNLDLTLVSIGGGERDFLVRSDLTRDPFADVNVLATAVPGVWCSTDHLSITWCKQLIMAIIRSLFDVVDLRTKQVSEDRSYRRAVFEYHLLKRSAGKKFLSHPKREAFEKNGRWVENLLRQFSVIEKKGTKTTEFVMLRLINDPKHEVATLEAINLNVKDWVYVCVADVIYNDQRICDEGINLSNLTEIIPGKKQRRKYVKLNLLDLKTQGFTHVIVRIPPLASFVQLNVDVHQASGRVISQPVPRLVSLKGETILENSADNAVDYRFYLTGFDQIWQAFQLNVEAVTCRTAASQALVKFSVSWANESQFFSLVDQKELSASLKLKSPRPVKENATVYLDLFLDPSCKYRVSISSDKIAIFGQIVRYYSQLLPGYILAIILLTIRRQLESIDGDNGVPFFHNALAESVRKYYILLQATFIGSKILGVRFFTQYLPVPDFVTLQDNNLDFFLLRIFLFAVATALVYIIGAAIYAAVVISGQAAHKLAIRFLARSVTGFLTWSEWIISVLHELPFIVSATVLAILYVTCGALGLVLNTIFFVLKLCKLYEDYLEGLFKLSLKYVARTIKSVTTKQEEKKEEEENKEGEADDRTEVVQEPEKKLSVLEEIHFQVSLCLLYATVAAISVPSLLAWSRTYHESYQLLKDPVWLPGIISCAGCFFWRGGVPHPNKKFAQFTSWALFGIAVVSIMFGCASHYRLPYFASLAIVLLVIRELTAR